MSASGGKANVNETLILADAPEFAVPPKVVSRKKTTTV
jgi:hypothetical protein